MGIIEEKVTPDSIVYTDCSHAHDSLNALDFHNQLLNCRHYLLLDKII